jgi:glycosyltransferase involved in cell wall biosynthesis
MAKICYLTDLAPQGSGYMNLSLPLCEGLSKLHDVKVIGLGNDGKEHNFEFPIFPVKNLEEIMRTVSGLWQLWNLDYFIVALDITLQEQILRKITDRPFKYVGLFPIEADPLCFSWASLLMMMDKQFIISEFGTNEAHKRGVMSAEHIQIGIDTDAWRKPFPGERDKLRQAYNIGLDTKVVLTNADNQERKNFFAHFEAFKRFSDHYPDSKYILITREHNLAGWKLRDLALEYKIADKMMIVERGIPFSSLWSYYAMSDCLLNISKAEGLGLPVLEAMSVGIPVIATDCTAMGETVADGRGILVPWHYRYVDPFGNGFRYLADYEVAAAQMIYLFESGKSQEFVTKARQYVEGRTWDVPVQQVHNYIMKDQLNEQTTAETTEN